MTNNNQTLKGLQGENSRLISFSMGTQVVTIGDYFEWHGIDKPTYQVMSFVDSNLSYSPSGLGGAIGVNVRNLNTGVIEEWCGDSVASGIYTTLKKSHHPSEKEKCYR